MFHTLESLEARVRFRKVVLQEKQFAEILAKFGKILTLSKPQWEETKARVIIIQQQQRGLNALYVPFEDRLEALAQQWISHVDTQTIFSLEQSERSDIALQESMDRVDVRTRFQAIMKALREIEKELGSLPALEERVRKEWLWSEKVARKELRMEDHTQFADVLAQMAEGKNLQRQINNILLWENDDRNQIRIQEYRSMDFIMAQMKLRQSTIISAMLNASPPVTPPPLLQLAMAMAMGSGSSSGTTAATEGENQTEHLPEELVIALSTRRQRQGSYGEGNLAELTQLLLNIEKDEERARIQLITAEHKRFLAMSVTERQERISATERIQRQRFEGYFLRTLEKLLSIHQQLKTLEPDEERERTLLVQKELSDRRQFQFEMSSSRVIRCKPAVLSGYSLKQKMSQLRKDELKAAQAAYSREGLLNPQWIPFNVTPYVFPLPPIPRNNKKDPVVEMLTKAQLDLLNYRVYYRWAEGLQGGGKDKSKSSPLENAKNAKQGEDQVQQQQQQEPPPVLVNENATTTITTTSSEPGGGSGSGGGEGGGGKPKAAEEEGTICEEVDSLTKGEAAGDNNTLKPPPVTRKPKSSRSPSPRLQVVQGQGQPCYRLTPLSKEELADLNRRVYYDPIKSTGQVSEKLVAKYCPPLSKSPVSKITSKSGYDEYGNRLYLQPLKEKQVVRKELVEKYCSQPKGRVLTSSEVTALGQRLCDQSLQHSKEVSAELDGKYNG